MQVPPTHRSDADHEMTDELLISAYMDGSRDDQPGALLSQKGLQTWDLYHLIGDTLRSPELGFAGQSLLSQKISIALESEPVLKPELTQRSMSSSDGFKRPGKMRNVVWPSLAMAAAVASVIWVARPFFVPEQVIPPAQQVAVADPIKPVDPAAVNDYLQAHRQLSGPAAVRQVSFTPGASR